MTNVNDLLDVPASPHAARASSNVSPKPLLFLLAIALLAAGLATATPTGAVDAPPADGAAAAVTWDPAWVS